ncbi:hypothetical protein GGR52DRAFT_151705 [Hypoxylon sp. FL1284]|nr:hypothetical protein GGR52DRAFT_151705 [Hypoxylon sp. FL1284]
MSSLLLCLGVLIRLRCSVMSGPSEPANDDCLWSSLSRSSAANGIILGNYRPLCPSTVPSLSNSWNTVRVTASDPSCRRSPDIGVALEGARRLKSGVERRMFVNQC